MSIIHNFILNNFDGSTKSEITRCLNKATIILFDSTNILVANEDYVYYFGSIANTKNTIKFYRKYKHLISGKKSFTKNKKLLKVMAKKILGQTSNGTSLYVLK